VYSKQLSFNQKYKGIYSYGFQSDNSTFVINYDDPIYEISHHIFQLSLSRKLNNIFNITFGLRSNFFKSKLKNSETIEYVEFSTGIFDNIQIITTLNCENKLYNYYVLLKTQNGMNKMDGSGFFDGYNLSFKTEPFVSFPGLFSYGFQYKILEKSNINVEVLHEFLFISNDYYENNIFMDGHNIFNTELYIGSNYEIINGLNLGLMYSKYISYDDEIGLGNKTSNSVFTESNIRNPWSIVFASQYLYKSFRIAFNYQYSKITYKIENDDKIIDAGHFIKLGFGVSY
jgi:hypothetical protein